MPTVNHDVLRGLIERLLLGAGATPKRHRSLRAIRSPPISPAMTVMASS